METKSHTGEAKGTGLPEIAWRELGGQYLLVTKHGGSKVVVGSNHAGFLVTRDEATGLLEKAKPDFPMLAALADRFNAYPDLLKRVSELEQFLGLRDCGVSLSERIARDMKLGVFPNKSEQTIAEEAQESQLLRVIVASVKVGVPMLSEGMANAIATSVLVKIRAALNSKSHP